MEVDENRSKSYRDKRTESSNYDYSNPNPSGMQDLRCYSASYASSSTHQPHQMEIVVAANNWKFNKAKSTNNWRRSKSLHDPELQRKKRVAGYKVYSVQAKIKGSFSNSFRWVKDKCSKVIHGYR